MCPSLSGDFSADGLATKQGYQTWAAYQNAHGGILGRPIVMDFLSDGSSPTQIVTNYQKLITVDKVDFTLGPYSTLLTKPASVITNRYGYVMLEGIGGGPSVFSQGLKNVFDVSASATYQMVTVAKWIAATQTPQPIAYATMDDPFIKPTLDGASLTSTARASPRPPTRCTRWRPRTSLRSRRLSPRRTRRSSCWERCPRMGTP